MRWKKWVWKTGVSKKKYWKRSYQKKQFVFKTLKSLILQIPVLKNSEEKCTRDSPAATTPKRLLTFSGGLDKQYQALLG